MTTTATEVQTVQVYQLFIKAGPEAVWDAITKPEFTRQYFYGMRIETTRERRRVFASDDDWGDDEIIEFDPPRLTNVPVPCDWRFVIANTLVRAEKSGAAQIGYNERTRECRAALSERGRKAWPRSRPPRPSWRAASGNALACSRRPSATTWPPSAPTSPPSGQRTGRSCSEL